MMKNMNINGLALQAVTADELDKVEGGVVPLGAVVREGTRAFVFVQAKDGTFERRAVTLGRSDDRWVAITHGLAAGEYIAVTAAAELQTAYASVR